MKEISPLKKHLRESPDLQRLRHKRKMLRVRFATLFSIFLIVLCFGFIYLARYPKLQIQTVTVAGNQITDTSDIVSHVKTYLAGHYAYVIPHSNLYLYPKKAIIADLMSSFPRFRSVSVYRTSKNTIFVDVNEVHAIALWCGNGIDTIDTSVPCYFTDDAGKVVAPAPYYSGNVYRRFFGSTLLSDGIGPLGHQFIEPTAFKNLMIFSQRVSDDGFAIKAIRIGPGNEDAFVLDLGGNKTALIRFLSADEYHVLAENLFAAISKPELASQLKKNRLNLEYFDLRFTNKVYYKFADAPVVVPPTAKQAPAKAIMPAKKVQ